MTKTDLRDFYWQPAMELFRQPGHLEALKRDIADQEEHHRGESFQDECRRLLRKFSVPDDERDVQD